MGAVGGGAQGPSRLKRQLPRTRLLKLSEKGSSNARSPDSAAIGGTKRAEKCLLGGPQGYALDAPEAFRTVSLGNFANYLGLPRKSVLRTECGGLY